MKKLLFIILLFPYLLCAQINIVNENGRKEPSPEMITQVKLLSQFIERFNYTKTFDDKPIDSLFEQQVDRENYIKLLFNLHDSRLLHSDSIPTEYSQLRNKFISEVCSKEKPLFIDKYTSQIFAKALCSVQYKGKTETMQLTLQRLVNNNKTMQWKITDVEATFLEIEQTDDDKIVFIPPNSHETNFMSLARIFADKQHFTQVIQLPDTLNTQANKLQLFALEIYNENLIFQHVAKITYIIKAIRGWEIELEEFNRNHTNSGWLINNIVTLPKP